MQTKFQCENCLHIQALPAKLAGKRILCPMCEDAITIPKADGKRTFKKQKFSSALEKFKLSDWDRTFAKALFKQKKMDSRSLYRAIIAVVKAAKKGREVGLGEYLRGEGAITAEECERIRTLVRGQVGDDKEEFIECPNCFANISGSSHSCKFCGQKIGHTQAIAICPNCKHEQATGHSRCRRCMADMKTGLRGAAGLTKHCPGCGFAVEGDPKKCPRCKAKLGGHRRPDRKAEQRGLLLRIAAGAAITVLLLGWICYHPIKTLVRSCIVGSAQAKLEDRVRLFTIALDDNALDRIEAFLDPEAEPTVERNTRGLILLGKDFKGRVKRVQEITVKNITLNESQTEATVEVLANLMVQETVLKDGPAGSAAIDDARGRLGLGQPREETVTWKWVRKSTLWLLVPDLP